MPSSSWNAMYSRAPRFLFTIVLLMVDMSIVVGKPSERINVDTDTSLNNMIFDFSSVNMEFFHWPEVTWHVPPVQPYEFKPRFTRLSIDSFKLHRQSGIQTSACSRECYRFTMSHIIPPMLHQARFMLTPAGTSPSINCQHLYNDDDLTCATTLAHIRLISTFVNTWNLSIYSESGIGAFGTATIDMRAQRDWKPTD